MALMEAFLGILCLEPELIAASEAGCHLIELPLIFSPPMEKPIGHVATLWLQVLFFQFWTRLVLPLPFPMFCLSLPRTAYTWMLPTLRRGSPAAIDPPQLMVALTLHWTWNFTVPVCPVLAASRRGCRGRDVVSTSLPLSHNA